MKKFKLFIIAGIILVASSLIGTIVANAQEPDKFKQKEDEVLEEVCIPYYIICDKGNSEGTICGTSLVEIDIRLRKMAAALCD